MDFNLSTFVLEIINFLVLIWILQRLFYKPLLAVIAKRKAFIDETLSQAKSIQSQAETERRQYENRLKLWEEEKQAALATLQQQLAIERSKQLEHLQIELQQEKQKAQIALSYQQQQFQEQAQKQGLANAARFAALILQQAATPYLEEKLCQLLLHEWQVLPKTLSTYLESQTDKKHLTVSISSVYELNSALKTELEQKLNALTAKNLAFAYSLNAELIAGLRIDLGAWILQANVQHELAGFAEIADAAQ